MSGSVLSCFPEIFKMLLEKHFKHFSKSVEKIWLTAPIVFRIILTAVAGEFIYKDEQSKFVCNTEQPRCENACYDAFTPLSHVHFWVFQIILVATPLVIYLGYAIHKGAKTEPGEADKKADQSKYQKEQGKEPQAREETEEDHEENPMMYPETELESEKKNKKQNQPKPKHDGRRRIQENGLMKIYVLQLLARTVFEVGFLIGQYFLYGFQVHPSYVCSRIPCPHKIDCFISRPTEKTIFLLIMYVVTGLCLLLNIWEILNLALGTIGDSLNSKRREPEDPFDPFTWNTPSAPPDYNIAVKPDQIQHTKLSNAKIAYKQNKAQEQQYSSHEEHLPADLEAAVGDQNGSGSLLGLLAKIKCRMAQERVDLVIQAYSHQNNPHIARGQGKAKVGSKARSNKSSASSKSGNGKTSVWI